MGGVPRKTILSVLLAPLLLVPSGVAAQDAVPVRFTAARSYPVRASVRLPGSVESPRASTVASEAEALVVALDVEEGQTVSAGQPLARLRTIFYEIQLRAARGRLEEARARLQLAASKLERARELFDDRVISQDELDDAYSEHAAWQGREDQALAEIAGFELSIDRCVIRAPFGGVVTRKRTDVGQWMSRGGEVVDLVALSELDVRVEVPERYFRLIGDSVAATVSFEALPGRVEQGRVVGVIPAADPQARTFPIRVRVSNESHGIGIGMLASVDLPVGPVIDALVVPKDAVVRDGADEMVFGIAADDTVKPVPVESGQGVGDWIVVRGDLEAGLRVVTRGNERLRPGQLVRAEPQEYDLP